VKLEGLVLDDNDAKKTGDWTQSSAVTHRVGTGYVHDDNAHKGEMAITFTPPIPEEGTYEVFLIYSPHANRARNVPVRLSIVGLPEQTVKEVRRIVDQKTGNGLASLGRHHLPKGQGLSVTISNKDTDGYVVADGLQVLPVK
jgi:hypothetical protein